MHSREVAAMHEAGLEPWLAGLRKGLSGVSGKRRESVVAEIAGDLELRMRSSGVDADSFVAGLEDPRALGRALRAVHGLSWWRYVIAYLLALPLGLLSVPLDSVLQWWPSTLMLALLLALTLRSGARGGRIHGLLVGLTGALPRIIVLLLITGLLGELDQGYGIAEVPGGTIAFVVLTSLMIPLFGFFATGRLRQ